MITAAAIAEAYKLMNYDAVGVARPDLAAGLEFLQEISRRSSFAWLSANLVHKDSGLPFFAASTIRNLAGLRIGVIALTDSATPLPAAIREEADILPWQDVLPRLATGLARNCDLLVLLSNYDQQQNRLIAETVPAIKLIIQAGTGVQNQPPLAVGNALICQAERQGKHLGLLEINWQQSGIWGTDQPARSLAEARGEMDGINWRLIRLEKSRPPAELATDAAYKNLLLQKERAAGTIKELEMEINLQKLKDQAPSSYNNSFIAIETNLPEDQQVQAIVAESKKLVNELGRTKALRNNAAPGAETPLAGHPEPDGPAGWKSCGGCHEAQSAFWQKTRHAAAYKTLADRQQEFNLNCLPCHVTRVSDNSSAINADILTLPPGLQKVGCEACHGAGRQHAADPQSSPLARKPGPAICLACHRHEHDDKFNYDHDLKIISCPKS